MKDSSSNKRIACFAFVSVVTFLVLGLMAHAQTYTPLYNLGSKTGDPMNPQPIGSFSQGRDGALYSTATAGGSNKGGAAYKITTAGALTKLFDFNLYPLPSAPLSGLSLGLDGNFYGTTSTGGTIAGRDRAPCSA
ncbi:MAG TPA: choice-of-anchor tandem repeat GloVer-containing protein [Terriglobales bacterium]|jgi:hypothetical protein|nr:choice-of-anchor tandem repeat GloVer-containing protein [Terriglobales bacterium]